jgi:uncharacterized protein (DUF342 family)
MEYIVSGKTVEKALSKGLKEFKLSLEEVDLEVLDFGERKLFLSRPATIKLKTKSSQMTHANLHDHKQGEERHNPEEESHHPKDNLRDTLSDTDLYTMIRQLPSAIVDGTAECKGNIISVTDPENNGSYAVIVIPSEIQLLVDDKEIKKSAVVTSKNRIHIQANRKDASRHYEIKVSQDSMKASLKVTYEDGYEVLIEDSKPEQRLSLSIVQKPIAAPKYTLAEISDTLLNKGIKYGIDWTFLMRVLEEGDGKWHDFAVGTSPIQGEDGKLEILIDLEEKESEKNIVSNVNKIVSVQEGEVLAKILPPKPGKTGMNIYGVTLAAPSGKEAKIRPGIGVDWMEENQVFISTSVGRPSVNNGALEVIPCHIIDGDVHFVDGGLEFAGDVVIKGTVHEGVRIYAGGNVTVYGYVYHSKIEALGSVTISNQVVGGHVKAGASQVCFVQAVRILDEILQTWNNVMLAVNQLEQIQAFKQQDLMIKGIGQLLKLLMETKFKGIPLLVKRLQQLCEENESLSKDPFNKISLSLQKNVLGFGPLQFQSKEDVARETAYWRDALEQLEEKTKWKENVDIGSAFNATIEASGNVTVRDWGVENCFLVAGESAYMQGNPGTVRGGLIIANDKVKVNEIGTPGGAKTKVNLPESGQFEAIRTYPNTWVKIGLIEKEYKGNEDRFRMKTFIG